MPRRGTRPLLHPAPVPPYVTGTEQKDRSPGPFRACAGSNTQARRTLRVRGRQGGTRAPARGHAVPADPPVSGMTSWGLAAASAWLQRYGMPAEPAPAPVMRGGAAPAQPVCYGLRPDSARRWTTWREPGRAAVQTPSAPPGRYCLPPSPARRLSAPGRWNAGPSLPTRPAWLRPPRVFSLGLRVGTWGFVSSGPRATRGATVRNAALLGSDRPALFSSPPLMQISPPGCSGEVF